MNQSDGAVSSAWGTWEELLLASAVQCFGDDAWDKIASELQLRSSHPILFTANNCRLKYLNLKRGVDDKSTDLVEELRKVRVAELRRELQSSELKIESLKMKLKGLEEEREPDLEEKSNTEKGVVEVEPVEQPVAGDEPEKAGPVSDSTGGGGEEEPTPAAKEEIRRGSTSGDERKHEDQESSAESKPLTDCLQAIRDHSTPLKSDGSSPSPKR